RGSADAGQRADLAGHPARVALDRAEVLRPEPGVPAAGVRVDEDRPAPARGRVDVGVLELVEAHQERLVADPDRLPPVPVALEDGLAALAAPGEVRAQGGEALLRLPLAAVDDELLGGPVG